MELKGITGGIYNITEWIFRLAVVNVLWMGFTVLGLGLFGAGPATAALFTVMRKWLEGDTELPIFKTFAAAYKKEFVKANGISWIFYALFLILYVDFKSIVGFDGSLKIAGYSTFLLFLVIVLITFMYVFPFNACFDASIKNCIKNAFLISIYLFPSTLVMVITMYLYFLLIKFVPGLLPFFGISLIGYIMMWIAWRGFMRLPESVIGNVAQ